jgi:hypothetical protein
VAPVGVDLLEERGFSANRILFPPEFPHMKPNRFLSVIATLCVPVFCLAADLPPGLKAEPFRAASKPGGKTLFTRLDAAQTGINVVNRMNVDHPLSYLYHSGMTTGGVVVADFDGDGKPDIFFAGANGKNQLYRQVGKLGEMRFEDIAATAGPGVAGVGNWSTGAAAADVNGDGRIDLYVCNYMKPNQLFLNMGPGPNGEPVVFKEVAAPAGLDAVDCSHSAYFADYDGDGRLDMYLLTNRIEDPNGAPKEMPVIKNADGTVTLKPEAELYYEVWRYDFNNWGTEAKGTPDRLYHNDGNGPDGVPRFSDVTKKAGISGRGDGLSAVWWDYDGDGLLDLYVANDFIAADKLYHNNGDGTFTNKVPEAVPHTPWFSMGSDIGDVNNDLLPDLIVADMSATSHYKSKTTMGIMGGIDLKRSYFDDPPQYMRNALYLNTGTGRFREGARLFGISSTDWTWSVKCADFDLDGWQDLYFTNGISRHMNNSDIKLTADMLTGKHMFDYFKNGEMRKEQHRAYRNTHHDKFEEVSQDWGLDHVGVSYGCAYADLDRDGDLDLIEVNLEEPNCIYRNDVQTGHRVLIKLVGTKSNSQGLGATVVIRAASGPQMRQLQPQSGYHSCNEALVHFGLGADTKIGELTVCWPGGGEQRFTDLAADMFYTITQPADGGAPVKAAPKRETMFAKTDVLNDVKVKDGGWEGDFVKQTLLPHALSQLGPCLAWGDVNGDGLDDFYFGGTKGELGQLRINDGKGKYVAKWVEAFRADKECESMGAVFFDTNGDGAPDLFVATGSNEYEKGAKELHDRLYLNDGKGNFTAAPAGALPEAHEFSSAVCAVDYDRDGRVDLFVGARCVPGDWPHSGRSRLLHNESANGEVKFVDVTDSVPGLANAGLVTAAVWSDIDGDGWPDLLVATEYGPIRFFQNVQGKLVEKTNEAGLAPFKGWWNSITTADVNGDGQFDLIVGNVGLNTKYKQPAADHPQLVYYSDFDGSGKSQIVEVKREGENLLPERGRSCSSTAMPFITEKFPTFHAFAVASLSDVYTDEKLKTAERYEATEFQSGVFINDHGKFTFKPFDRIAQIAPVFGIVVCDFNGDGNPDIFLAQNFFGPQIENPRYDGGVGQLLLGDGKGGFVSADPRDSGIVITGDMKSASVMDSGGRPGIAVTVNNGSTASFENQTNGRWLRVVLPAARAPGARVTLRRAGMPERVAEVHSGSGYLAQESASAWFGLGASTGGGTVRVVWSDGTATELPFNGKVPVLKVAPESRSAGR